MEIAIITSEHFEATYFDRELIDWGKSDWPAAESIFGIVKRMISRDLVPTGIHVYYADDVPEAWYASGPGTLEGAMSAFFVPADAAEKLAEAERLTGMKLKPAGPEFRVSNELHWPEG